MNTNTLTKCLLGKDAVKEISKKTEADSSQVQQLVAAALPLLVSGMNQNAQTEEGAKSLAKALDQHKKKDTTSSKAVAALVKDADEKDGKKAVKHILGDKTSEITKGLSKKTGLTSKQVTTILAVLAPILLSMLGSSKDEEEVESSSSGMSSMLGSLLGVGSSGSSSFGLDDVASLLLGSALSSNSSSSSSGSLLSSLLGGSANSNSGSSLLGSLLGSSSGSSSNSDALGSLSGSLLGSLLGGSSSSSSSKDDDTAELLGSLLGSLLK
ncbi:MAG: DUF937 domain-containing protein [Oscillospiraceae bacterium]|nr:DUF937 domain-containing protein [Oscillospiraceae bacterium]